MNKFNKKLISAPNKLKSYQLPANVWCNKQCNGFITLVSVLVVGAVGVAIALSLILIGLGSSRTSIAVEQSNQAKALTKQLMLMETGES